ncbi:EAL domain-containing protein [Burkholderia ubonensis]|uniref:EAL domain-containing protein n=1 Tax=Burkholderia ubonensis TaxID=101571 RepID=UPI0018DFDDC0|nr:EAL domain-containing protein [Burkholderia ubonensis]
MALLRKEFFVVYQPIVDVASNRVVSHEALVRWRHPVKGVVMPTEFIGVAEHSELICGITDAVLDHVFLMLSTRQNMSSDFPVSVNISPTCFSYGQVVDVIRGKAKIYNVAPRNIVLEITETAPVDASGRISSQLEELREMGVGIVMDDFGVGFSKIENILKLPFSGIKIDSSLINKIPDDDRYCALISGVIEIARKLDLSVVAEGVENNRQLAWVRKYPGVLAQGWLLGVPCEF